MKKLLYIFLLICPILSSGCIGYQEIRVVKIKDVSYQDFDIRARTLKLDIVATVDNPNFYNVRLTNADMVLRHNDRILGNVTQLEKIELEGKKEKDYTIRIAIEMKDVFSNVMGIYRLFTNNPKELNLSGTVHVKAFMRSKTYQIDNLSFQ